MTATDLIPIAAELVGTVRDYGPEDVQEVLARVPDGRVDELALVLAAMVDPDASPAQLLAWQNAGPVQSRDVPPPRKNTPKRTPGARAYPREHGSDRGYYQHRRLKDWPACDACLAAHADRTHALTKNRRKARKKAAERVQEMAS